MIQAVLSSQVAQFPLLLCILQFQMKTITIHLQNDKDAELLMDMLRTTKFESDIETFEENDAISNEELQMLNERVEGYRKDPSKAKDLQEVRQLLKSKYGI